MVYNCHYFLVLELFPFPKQKLQTHDTQTILPSTQFLMTPTLFSFSINLAIGVPMSLGPYGIHLFTSGLSTEHHVFMHLCATV